MFCPSCCGMCCDPLLAEVGLPAVQHLFGSLTPQDKQRGGSAKVWACSFFHCFFQAMNGFSMFQHDILVAGDPQHLIGRSATLHRMLRSHPRSQLLPKCRGIFLWQTWRQRSCPRPFFGAQNKWTTATPGVNMLWRTSGLQCFFLIYFNNCKYGQRCSTVQSVAVRYRSSEWIL